MTVSDLLISQQSFATVRNASYLLVCDGGRFNIGSREINE
jgi:hypothetical protein